MPRRGAGRTLIGLVAVILWMPTVSSAAPPDPIARADILNAMVDGGLVIVGDDDLDARGRPFAVTATQADHLADQVALGGGVLGLELRADFPLPDDVVPMDALVGAWLTMDRPGAEAARRLVDVGTLVDPASFVFPWAVINLFLVDVAGHATSSPTPTTTSTIAVPLTSSDLATEGGPSGWLRPAGVPDLCGALQQFYADTIGAAITALAQSESVLGVIVGYALDTLAGVLGELVSALTPNVLVLAVQGLAIAAAIAGAVEPWTASLVAEPPATSMGIAPAAGNPGAVTLRVSAGSGDWSAPVRSCAQLMGIDLPSLDPSDAPATWEVVTFDLADEVARETTITRRGDVFEARLDYTTRVETVGPNSLPTVGLMTIDGQVHRQDRETLTTLLETVIARATALIPPEILAVAVGAAADQIVGLLDVTDPLAMVAVIPVEYHVAGEDPPPVSLPADESDGCVGRVLTSRGVGGAAGVLLRLDEDGSGVFEFDDSLPYGGTTWRGRIGFTWTGGPDQFVTVGGVGTVTVSFAIMGEVQTIELTDAEIADLAPSETLVCDNGTITIARTGEIYEAGP